MANLDLLIKAFHAKPFVVIDFTQHLKAVIGNSIVLHLDLYQSALDKAMDNLCSINELSQNGTNHMSHMKLFLSFIRVDPPLALEVGHEWYLLSFSHLKDHINLHSLQVNACEKMLMVMCSVNKPGPHGIGVVFFGWWRSLGVWLYTVYTDFVI